MRRRFVLFFIWLVVWLTTDVLAGTFDGRVFFSSGVFSFRQKNFREMYGQLPLLNLGLEIFPGKNYGLGLGIVYLSGQGQALVISGEPDQVFKLRFSRWSVPLTFKLRMVKGKFAVQASVGGAFSFIQERWPELGLWQKERNFHLRYEVGGDFRPARNLVLKLILAAENISGSHNSPALFGAQPDLGGFSLQLGLAYQFKIK
jgi:hypothetical protein